MKDGLNTDVTVHRGIALTSFYHCSDLYHIDPYPANTRGKEIGDGRLQLTGAWRTSQTGQQDRRTAVL